MSDIYLIGHIDELRYKKFLYKLHQAKQEKITALNIYISTDGGDVELAAGIFDEIEGCKKQGITVTTIGLGRVLSAGTFILSAGDIRCGTENCSYMIHEFSYQTKDYHGQTLEYVKFTDKYYKNLMVSLAARCGRNSPKEIQKFLADAKQSIWLDTDSAIKFGLIDKKWNYSNEESDIE